MCERVGVWCVGGGGVGQVHVVQVTGHVHTMLYTFAAMDACMC